eukprot:Amastigsp_a1738_39.p6 type:complete len:102 gc:universal Amastigsp_a1738_39:859-1164(+)
MRRHVAIQILDFLETEPFAQLQTLELAHGSLEFEPRTDGHERALFVERLVVRENNAFVDIAGHQRRVVLRAARPLEQIRLVVLLLDLDRDRCECSHGREIE